MTRAYEFTVVGIITIVAVVIHVIGTELFLPGTVLWQLATTGTEAMNGEQRARLWSQVLVIWVPLFSVAGVLAWAFLREYRRQSVSGRRARRRKRGPR